MRDGIIGVTGTGTSILLQEVSLWLSVICASLTILHFALLYYNKFKGKK